MQAAEFRDTERAPLRSHEHPPGTSASYQQDSKPEDVAQTQCECGGGIPKLLFCEFRPSTPERMEFLKSSTGKYNDVSTVDRLHVQIGDTQEALPRQALSRSPTFSYTETGDNLLPQHPQWDLDSGGFPSDDTSEWRGSTTLLSTPHSSPRPSLSSTSPLFSSDRPSYDSEGPNDETQDFLNDSAFRNDTPQRSFQKSRNADHNEERPYTSSLGVPDPWEGEHASELALSVISDAGDQQYKQQKKVGDVEEPAPSTAGPSNEEQHASERAESFPISPCRHELQSELFDALVQTRNPEIYHPESGFLPKAQLYRLVNEESVYRELQKDLGQYHTEEKIRSYAAAVCKETEVKRGTGGKPYIKSFRKIFALLVLAETASSVSMFLEGEEDVSDLDLPLAVVRNRGTIDLRRRDSSGKPCNEPLKCFGHHVWSPTKLRTFDAYQWTMLAPFFSRGRNGEVKHYALQDHHILPFVASQEADDDDVEFHGGYGKVFMVRIHEEHHNFRDQLLCKRGFAIKQLYENNREAFKREVNILKKFSGDLSHRHVVSLLATYEQFKKYHLIFYRAEGDLFKYWKQIERNPELNYGSILWMAEQCAGIADGLLKLHRHLTFPILPRFDSEEELTRRPTGERRVRILTPPIHQERNIIRSSSRDLEQPVSPTWVPGQHRRTGELRAKGEVAQVERYGRHGDINPGNILWYNDSDDKTGILKGTLKISDFGQAEINSQFSRSRPRSVANTMTYRPPECDLQPRIIRQSYDIWCLGCVYLEFVTWILGGEKLLKYFSRKRRSPDFFNKQLETDTFFQIVWNPDTERTEVMIKPAVTKFFNYLHQLPNCTEYLHQLLDKIQHNMLIVESSQRMSCQEVWQLLEAMHKNCLEDNVYATRRNPWTISKLTAEPLTPSVEVDIGEVAKQTIAANFSQLPIHPGRPVDTWPRAPVGLSDCADPCEIPRPPRIEDSPCNV